MSRVTYVCPNPGCDSDGIGLEATLYWDEEAGAFVDSPAYLDTSGAYCITCGYPAERQEVAE